MKKKNSQSRQPASEKQLKAIKTFERMYFEKHGVLPKKVKVETMAQAGKRVGDLREMLGFKRDGHKDKRQEMEDEAFVDVKKFLGQLESEESFKRDGRKKLTQEQISFFKTLKFDFIDGVLNGGLYPFVAPMGLFGDLEWDGIKGLLESFVEDNVMYKSYIQLVHLLGTAEALRALKGFSQPDLFESVKKEMAKGNVRVLGKAFDEIWKGIHIDPAREGSVTGIHIIRNPYKKHMDMAKKFMEDFDVRVPTVGMNWKDYPRLTDAVTLARWFETDAIMAKVKQECSCEEKGV